MVVKTLSQRKRGETESNIMKNGIKKLRKKFFKKIQQLETLCLFVRLETKMSEIAQIDVGSMRIIDSLVGAHYKGYLKQTAKKVIQGII